MNKTSNKMDFSEYVQSFYNNLDRKNYLTYSDWKWFRTPSSKSQFIQTKKTIINALNGKSFDSAFEIGPGDGIWTQLFCHYAKKIDAIDISEEMLRMARARLKDKNVALKQGNFLTSKLKKKYDLIYSVRCIEYLPDKESLIKKISSIAKNGANVLIVTKNPHYFKIRNQDKNLHSNQIDILRLKALFEKQGFKVKCILPAVLGKGFQIPWFRQLLQAKHQEVLRKGSSPNNFFIKNFSESFLIYAQKNDYTKTRRSQG